MEDEKRNVISYESLGLTVDDNGITIRSPSKWMIGRPMKEVFEQWFVGRTLKEVREWLISGLE